MSTNDDEFTDELEQDEEIEEAVDDTVEAQADDEEASPTVAVAKIDPTLDEEAQLRTVSSRDLVRQQLEDEIKRFLSRGGHIDQLAADDTQKA